jgi:hypothetical protein
MELYDTQGRRLYLAAAKDTPHEVRSFFHCAPLRNELSISPEA